MARITVEDCLKKVDNRFNLIHMAAKRVRLLRKGDEPLVDSKNTDIVVALREIAAGKVFQSENDGEQLLLANQTEPLTAEALPDQVSEALDQGETDTEEEIVPDTEEADHQE